MQSGPSMSYRRKGRQWLNTYYVGGIEQLRGQNFAIFWPPWWFKWHQFVKDTGWTVKDAVSRCIMPWNCASFTYTYTFVYLAHKWPSILYYLFGWGRAIYMTHEFFFAWRQNFLALFFKFVVINVGRKMTPPQQSIELLWNILATLETLKVLRSQLNHTVRLCPEAFVSPILKMGFVMGLFLFWNG